MIIHYILSIIQFITIILSIILIDNNKKKIVKNIFAKERNNARKSRIEIEFIADDPHHENACQWRFYNNCFYCKTKYSKDWILSNKIHPTPERITMLESLIQQAKAAKKKTIT